MSGTTNEPTSSVPAGSGRPVVHFTPPRGWLNDPNGLLSVGGEHHLFYQHHPHDTVFGPMHWGHAVSTDFVTWRHLPIALAPDGLGVVYSGSAVNDIAGTTGLGAGAFVALFTYHTETGESQAMAWSTDGGETFTKFAGNPVIPVAPDRPMTRDPRVFWYPDDGGHWVMALAADGDVVLATSPDLRSWAHQDDVSVFTTIDGVEGGVETPDLFPLVADDGSHRWVMSVGLPSGPAGGSATAAVIGDFDGTRFTPTEAPHWVDHGGHFYAAQSWNDTVDRRVWIGWMGNWSDLPTAPPGRSWCGQMSIPRELSLRSGADGYRLAQTPIRELERYRLPGDVVRDVAVTAVPLRSGVGGRAVDVEVVGADVHGSGLEVHCRRGTLRLVVTARADRLAVSGLPFGDGSHRSLDAPRPGTGPIDLRIVLDTTSIEVFSGTATITALLPDSSDEWAVEASAEGADVAVRRLSVHALDATADPADASDA